MIGKKKFKEFVYEYDDTRYKGKYGFIEIENPAYEYDYTQEKYLIRKPTPQERKEIMLNYIIENSGKRISINYLSTTFAVSDRTIQKILKELKEKNLIKIIPTFKKDGTQRFNIYKYIGKPRIKTGKELTIDLLYNPDNPYGFRDFDWGDHKFPYDGEWYSNDELEELKIKNERKRKEFLKEKEIYKFIKLKIKYYHSIKGKDNIYTILKQYNLVKEYELVKDFNFKFYEFNIIGKIVNTYLNLQVEIYCNNELIGVVKDNKYKFLGYYIPYEADGRKYSKDIDVEARLI